MHNAQQQLVRGYKPMRMRDLVVNFRFKKRQSETRMEEGTLQVKHAGRILHGLQQEPGQHVRLMNLSHKRQQVWAHVPVG